MSTAPAAPAVQPYQEAYDTLHRDVYLPVFRTKLANDFGIQVPKGGEGPYLELAARLREEWNAANTKTAGLSLIDEALQRTEKRAAATGRPTQVDRDIRHVASQLAGNAKLAHAVLSMHVTQVQDQAA